MVADECRIQETPNPYYRWGEKGKSPVSKVRRSHNSVSFYGALSRNNKKVISHLCKVQNSTETINFLEEIKKRYCHKGTVLLVWDNASWHRSNEVRNWLEENPNVIELMNFPPYCPDLNPQEHVWKTLKNELTEIVHKFDFRQVTDRACRLLLTKKFDYHIF